MENLDPSDKDDDAPSAWVVRFAPHIPAGGTVLDLACGGGRHTRYLRGCGYCVVAVDIDVSGVRDLSADADVEIIETDVETCEWPFGARRFDGIVVTNYLHRPHLPRLVETLAPGGALIYETFAKGHEKIGRPQNPTYLLNPAELLDAFGPRLSIVAYEHGVEEATKRAVRQRICAVKASEPSRLGGSVPP